jgi:hypothetical protein
MGQNSLHSRATWIAAVALIGVGATAFRQNAPPPSTSPFQPIDFGLEACGREEEARRAPAQVHDLQAGRV